MSCNRCKFQQVDAVVEGGRVRLDDRPGIGFEGKAAFHRVLRDLHA